MLDEERHVGGDADAGIQWFVEDVEVAQAGQHGIAGSAAQHRAHLVPEVLDLVRAEPARAYFGRDGKAGRALGGGGLFRNSEFSPDQLSVARGEAENVGEVPQQVLAAERVREELLPFHPVGIGGNDQESTEETGKEVERLVRHRPGPAAGELQFRRHHCLI
ncbi:MULTISPECIES: hypothetical protein [unclassified Streptomyces]|uniref:hypothetical protein n=1 Tax=unclassified Streptomyces TaxID=2593676 RepID=UPI0033AE54FB